MQENAIKRMRTGSNSHRLEPAEGLATISGAVITTKEGDTNSIQSIQVCLLYTSPSPRDH